MSDGDLLSWVTQAVSKDPTRPDLLAPFSVQAGGVVHTVATNGHILLSVPNDLGCPPMANSNVAARVGEMLTATRNGHMVSLADLRAFCEAHHAEPLPETEDADDDDDEGDCSFCAGEGEIDVTGEDGSFDTVGCPRCDGDGLSSTWRRTKPTPATFATVSIFGVPYDNRLLEKPLLTAPFVEWVSVFTDEQGGKPMYIESGLWRITVMPLREYVLTGRTPRFPSETPVGVTSDRRQQ